MQIKQLEALVNVIDFGSFSKAAEATYLSQPTISSHIRTLEREVGTKLVVRSTKEIYPSHAGKVLYEYAKEILKLRERAMIELKHETSSISGTLQIGVTEFPSECFLPEFISKFSEKYEELTFKIINYSNQDISEAILNNGVEVSISESDIEKRNITLEPIADIQYVFITPENNKYTKMQEEGVGLVELLKNSRFILSKDGSVLYQNLIRYISSIGLERRDLNIIASMQNVRGIIEAVRNGLGISLVPVQYLTDKDGLLIFGKNTDSKYLNRNLFLAYHSNKPLSPAAEVFVQELKRKYIMDKSGPLANI
ncbi:MAG TPA: LysR family transcriptional regulator [Clostridiaceae bacterium]|nr:LysR family transcriptional regulator [Clostridiaceae bacterium]